MWEGGGSKWISHLPKVTNLRHHNQVSSPRLSSPKVHAGNHPHLQIPSPEFFQDTRLKMQLFYALEVSLSQSEDKFLTILTQIQFPDSQRVSRSLNLLQTTT